jgi:hypothetical protein
MTGGCSRFLQDATGQRGVGIDHGVLYSVGQQKQHHQIEDDHLLDFAFAGQPEPDEDNIVFMEKR